MSAAKTPRTSSLDTSLPKRVLARSWVSLSAVLVPRSAEIKRSVNSASMPSSSLRLVTISVMPLTIRDDVFVRPLTSRLNQPVFGSDCSLMVTSAADLKFLYGDVAYSYRELQIEMRHWIDKF